MGNGADGGVTVGEVEGTCEPIPPLRRGRERSDVRQGQCLNFCTSKYLYFFTNMLIKLFFSTMFNDSIYVSVLLQASVVRRCI